jgi:choloylglycine hydrolase
MKIRTLLFTTYIFFICLIPQTGQACTTFCLDKGDQLVFGRNYDWMVDDCLVMVNKRGVSKTAQLGPEFGDKQPASWTSKYGSITFNQYGRESPSGGMNETGLVVDILALFTTKYPEPDSRPSVFAGQWIQYQLDNFSMVEQVIASDSQIRIVKPSPRALGAHFLVSDRMGNCASIEFLDGKMVYHTNKTMPVKALTNSRYARNLKFWEKGKLPKHDLFRSVHRFVSVAKMLKNYNPKTSKPIVDYSFDILKNVANGGINGVPVRAHMATQWSIVYDIKNLLVYFRTFANQKIRHINLRSFDFSCKTPVKVLDVQTDLSGDVTKNFIDYTQQINRKLIGNAFKKTYVNPELSGMPEEVLDAISRYPETTICTDR